MKTVWFTVLAVVLLVSKGYCEEQVPTFREISGTVSEGSSAMMTVEAVDRETRNVTLKDEAGEVSVVKCGPEVRNFDQIAVGDTLTADLIQEVTLTVSNAPEVPNRTESIDVERAPLGEKPSGTITKLTDVTGTVESIDLVARTVTVAGPLKTLTVKVKEGAVDLDKLKKGDTVNLQVIEILAIAVTK